MKTRTLTVLAAVLASGCAKDRATVQIFGMCAPPAASTAACGESGICSLYLASPRPYMFLYVDPAVTTSTQPFSGATYVNHLEMFVQFTNQAQNNAVPADGRANTNDATINEYRLSYTVPGFTVPSVVYPTHSTIPAAGSWSPVVPLIPNDLLASVGSYIEAGFRTLFGGTPTTPSGQIVPVIVHVQAAGTWGDGSSFETATEDIAVDVYDAVFPGYGCERVTDIVTDWCPNIGQTAQWVCSTP